MAVTLADADRAVAAAEAAGVVLQVGFNRRFRRLSSPVRHLVVISFV
jgi:myo-inositol 2-dehydrogenase / D-chiro-inositol 1-dehydrogenase